MSVMLEKYNRLAQSYHLNRHTFDIRPLFDAFYGMMENSKKGIVLDLGCGIGDGFPEYFLEKGWQVEGIDFSSKMLELCKKYHPEISTKIGRLEELELPCDCYDVIEIIYALFHIPNAAQYECLQECYSGLKKGGFIFFTYADKEYTGSDRFEGHISFMGENLFYAHETPEVLEHQMQQIGFRNIQMMKHEVGGETFLWVCAQK